MIVEMFVALCLAQTPDADARAALALAQAAQKQQAPPVVEAKPEPKKPAEPELSEYAKTRLAAIKQRLPLVVFVGVEPRRVDGAFVVRNDDFAKEGYPAQCIFVALPHPELGMVWKQTLPVNASPSLIRQWAGLEVMRESRLPFFRRNSGLTADADIPASGRWFTRRETQHAMSLWPKNMPFEQGMKFYWPTTLSQRIAVTNDSPTNNWYDVEKDDVWGNAPTSFNPNRTDPRWDAPGGLHGIHGWESYTAAMIPGQIQTWVQPVPIANGGVIPGGKLWAFPTGTAFADLLVSDGKPFELRYREKDDDGQWQSYVAWRDKTARPDGYTGANRKCVECHRLAGDSEQYGITIRGKDTVFSFLLFDL